MKPDVERYRMLRPGALVLTFPVRPMLDDVCSPVQAGEAYGRALAILAAAERAVQHCDSDALQRTLLNCSDNVIINRVKTCRALLDAGLRLPDDVLFWLDIDAELIKVPAAALEPSWLLQSRQAA